MSESVDNYGIVEELRLKTEKNDVSQHLKSTLGGYTKASVHEYLNTLRKQQQATAETFSRNQQVLFDEKENLKKDNEALQTRLNRAEAEYQNLLSACKANEMNLDGTSAADIPVLKNKIAALEEELNMRSTEKSGLLNQLAQKSRSVNDLSSKLDTFEEERAALKEMLKAEMLESKKQRDMVARLSGTIEERDSEIRALSALMSESELFEQNETIGHLTERLAEQNELLDKYNKEKAVSLLTLGSINDENELLRKNVLKLSEALAEMGRQNDKLIYNNNVLSGHLEEEYKKSLTLIKEKTDISVEKMTAARRLEEANSKVALLELKLQKSKGDSTGKDVLENKAEIDGEGIIYSLSLLHNADSK